ncbi:TraB/GumN family protein [Shewanella acanthi]|uniref:TraB/GumN family protein n=1 Tax=Shewanella acanthi TaxID=2864212 RepID=UPI001C65C8E8|nr:TraB/GumN family protein [Shewanella acanthi]QYJ79260.1 TraB/GumN family protein [Shewanella acanthi]
MATSRWRRLLTLGTLMLSGIASCWAMPSDKPPFYQVQWQGKTAYLLGSIHIGRADFYPMPAQIETALSKAKGLVLEIDLSKIDGRTLLQQYAMADKSKGLDWQSRDTQTLETMEKYCIGKVSLCQSLQSFAPWLQATQVNLFRYKDLGYSAEYGVDMQFLGRATNMPVFELETAQSQFEMLSSFNSQTQWAMVRDAINLPDDELLELISAWRSGDETALDGLMQEQFAEQGGDEMLDKILWQRNHTMADGIIKLLGAESIQAPLFVVVGAGHVVGDKSVVQRLKQAGAKVTACWQEVCE